MQDVPNAFNAFMVSIHLNVKILDGQMVIINWGTHITESIVFDLICTNIDFNMEFLRENLLLEEFGKHSGNFMKKRVEHLFYCKFDCCFYSGGTMFTLRTNILKK